MRGTRGMRFSKVFIRVLTQSSDSEQGKSSESLTETVIVKLHWVTSHDQILLIFDKVWSHTDLLQLMKNKLEFPALHLQKILVFNCKFSISKLMVYLITELVTLRDHRNYENTNIRENLCI